jgi:hypothetical protein
VPSVRARATLATVAASGCRGRRDLSGTELLDEIGTDVAARQRERVGERDWIVFPEPAEQSRVLAGQWAGPPRC